MQSKSASPVSLSFPIPQKNGLSGTFQPSPALRCRGSADGKGRRTLAPAGVWVWADLGACCLCCPLPLGSRGPSWRLSPPRPVSILLCLPRFSAL